MMAFSSASVTPMSLIKSTLPLGVSMVPASSSAVMKPVSLEMPWVSIPASCPV